MPDPVRTEEVKPFEFERGKELPACFIHESILSCGGQVVLPNGFFKDLYHRFRKDGIVMIADEVQTGLGRIGTHMWAFEAEGVVPDIVTIGKPFGNGHPLAAVVCTEEVANAFHNGMEYFNTFGGNPVSCAIGLAVLNEIEDDDLQQHALDLGQYILDELQLLSQEHPMIADVRGRGLFLGWEFANPETKEPLAPQASFFVNEMKRHGVLLSTDGPLNNVIKFKPPMVFTKENADYMLTLMKKVMTYLVT
jgi:4-aminobutyrate aminotransferase-like enzyme